MNWQTNASLPFVEAKQIIVSAWNEGLGDYTYNVVSYYERMGIYYGGPGVVVTKEQVQFWAEIEAPSGI